MKMHIPLCEHKMTWVKKLLSLVPHNVASNFYMLLRVPNIVLKKKKLIFISLYLLKEYVCVCVHIPHILFSKDLMAINYETIQFIMEMLE